VTLPLASASWAFPTERSVRISQIWGARPALYPGCPRGPADRQRRVVRHARAGVHHVRDRGAKVPQQVLTVQAREGLNIGGVKRALTDWTRSAQRNIHATCRQPVGGEVVAPTVATIYRQLAPQLRHARNFATKREDCVPPPATAITARLGSGRQLGARSPAARLRLPEEYAKGLEGLLLKSGERASWDGHGIKQTNSAHRGIGGGSQKARDVKQAESKPRGTRAASQRRNSMPCR